MVTDLRLPVMDGVELLKRAKAVEQDVEVIMITGHGTVETGSVAKLCAMTEFVLQRVIDR